MSTPVDHQLHRDLGRLEAKLDALVGTVSDEFAAARANRAAVHQRLDDLGRAMAVMREKHDALETQVASFAPIVTKVNNWEQRKIGAIAVIGALSGVVGAALTSAKEKIFAFFAG